MRVAVAGGAGTVGRFVERALREHGHEPVSLTRSQGIDLMRDDIDLSGVDAVVDVLGIKTLSAVRSTRFFTTTTARLLAAERAGGVAHHLALSVVGAADAPYGYYAGKAAQEQLIERAGVPWTIQRSTQFFEFAEQTATRIGPLVVHPKMRVRPIAAAAVAARLVELVEAGPSGNVPDVAGPHEMQMIDVIKVTAHRASARSLIEFPLPGGFGRAIREGTILPSGEAVLLGPSLWEWAES